MYSGACLCENISWETGLEAVPVYHCHCSMCRKMHGAAFGTYALVPSKYFRWTSKLDTLAYYRSSPILVRSFCNACGSVVPNPDKHEDCYFIPIGSQEDGPEADCHIFVGSKAPWLEITDGLPKHQELPPNVVQPVFANPAKEPVASGELQGSCLCARIKFKVTAPFKKIYNCHCRRCRRARSAAFATNGFVSHNEMAFVQGKEHLRSYKLPEAKYFTQTFCHICGSGMPRISPEREIAVIPLGTLDDDPGQSPDCGIWLDSTADWYRPVNDLPAYPMEPPPCMNA